MKDPADSPWKTHSSQRDFQNPWFAVQTYQVTTPGGQPGIYGVIEFNPTVTVVAFNDREEFCLIRQFRYPHQQWMWELPIGATQGEADPLEAAKRELQEETGFTSDAWEYVGEMRGLKGLSNQILHTYLARDIVPGERHIEHDEGIDGQRFIGMKDFYEEVRQGTIVDEETIAAVTKVAAYSRLI